MSDATHGLRAVLSYSKIYDLFQRFVGAKKSRAFFAERYIRAQKGNKILDIGCGTAEIRDFLPTVEYYGFDPNPHYIKSAQNRLCDIPDCTFFCKPVDEIEFHEFPKFDIVLALGVLHHLDDTGAVQLAKLAKSALKDKGRLILVDPCFVEGQSAVARFFAGRDRGQHVRDADGYRKLMNTAFAYVNTEIRHDMLRFPYTHLIMECRAE